MISCAQHRQVMGNEQVIVRSLGAATALPSQIKELRPTTENVQRAGTAFVQRGQVRADNQNATAYWRPLPLGRPENSWHIFGRHHRGKGPRRVNASAMASVRALRLGGVAAVETSVISRFDTRWRGLKLPNGSANTTCILRRTSRLVGAAL